MEWLSDPAIWTALLTLTALEIVLGIDNIIFISILADRLPANQRQRARTTGLLAGDADAHRDALFDRLDTRTDTDALHGRRTSIQWPI